MRQLLLDHIFPNSNAEDDGIIIKESIQLNKRFIFEKILFKNIGICRMQGTPKSLPMRAIVKIQDIKANKKAKKAVTNELRIIRQCQHPYIIEHLAVYTEGSVVMQFFPFYSQGDLLSRHQRCALTDTQLRRVIAELLLAIEYLHSRRVVHADIKPENVLCANDAFLFDVKLIDFGNSEILPGNGKKRRLLGTLGYMAPEVMCNGSQGYPVDMWSLAVLLFALKSGRLPFGVDEHTSEYRDRVARCDVEYPRTVFGKHSPMKDFLKTIFVLDPAKRSTAAQCRTHPWICPTFDRLTFR